MHTTVTMYYNEFLIYFAILKLEIKISRTTALEFQDFPGFSRTYAFFQDFSGLEISTIKFHDFPGSVRTLTLRHTHRCPDLRVYLVYPWSVLSDTLTGVLTWKVYPVYPWSVLSDTLTCVLTCKVYLVYTWSVLSGTLTGVLTREVYLVYPWSRDLHGNGKSSHPHPLPQKLYPCIHPHPSPSDMVSIPIRPRSIWLPSPSVTATLFSIPQNSPSVLQSPKLIGMV